MQFAISRRQGQSCNAIIPNSTAGTSLRRNHLPSPPKQCCRVLQSSLAPHDLHSLLLYKIENRDPTIPQLSIICFIWGTRLALIDFLRSRPSKRTDSAWEEIELYLVRGGCGSEWVQALVWGRGRGSVMGMHGRDLMGILLMMLVFTEATRKYMTIKDLARMQAEAERLTSMLELNQLVSRCLLAPPAMKTNDDLPRLCQSPGMDCLPGEEVRCEMGRHEGCDCEYIQSCFPRASQCTFFNATHVRTCGF